MSRTKRKAKNIFRFYIRHGIRPLAKIIIFFTPYLTLLLHYFVHDIRLSIVFPVVSFSVCLLMLAFANEKNIGDDMPLPLKRFTDEDSYVGITVKKEELEDMIAYVNDLENWLEREGKI